MDGRQVMLCSEFDAVDYFVNEPGRPPAPPEKLGIYLASGLSQPGLAEQFDVILGGMHSVLDETVAVAMRPVEIGHAVIGRATGGGAWRGEKTRQWFGEVLRAGDVEGLDVSFSARRDPEDRFWHLDIRALPEDPDAAILISVTPSDNLWPPEQTDAVAERLVGLVESWVGPLELRSAAITLDRVHAGWSPWELWYGMRVNEMGPIGHEYLRGYYWWNLLTAGQLARLGGADAARRAAADAGFGVSVPATLPTAAPALVVRDPRPATAFDDTALARMKDLLAPALYPQPYGVYEGYPLRIVKDPGTAFRRVPTTELRPLLLTPEEMREGRRLYR
jgi:hypothetical protein